MAAQKMFMVTVRRPVLLTFLVDNMVEWFRASAVMIDLSIKIIVQLAHEHYVITSNNIKSHRHSLYTFLHAEYPFMAILQYDVDRLIKS